MEEERNIVELLDENGETVEFEHLATLEYEGAYYIALTPAVDDEEDEGEVLFMRIEEDENGEECYVYVEEEDLQEKVFAEFMRILQEEDEAILAAAESDDEEEEE